MSYSILDIESLLEPLGDENPTGDDVREDPSPTSNYQKLRSARSAARSAERQSIHDGPSNEAEAHWREIEQLAPTVLKEQAKDLEVACWLTESLIRRHGFAGLRDGFALLDGLVEEFWDKLYPMPDEDGIETRVACISGLNGEGAEGVLIAPIRRVPLTLGDEPPAPFSLWQYQQAVEAQKSPDDETRERKLSQLGFSTATISEAVNRAADDFYIALDSNIDASIKLYRNLGSKLDEHCGSFDAPPTSQIINTLEETLGVVRHIAGHKLPASEGEAQDNSEHEDAADGVSVAPSNSAPAEPKAMTRERAFSQLTEIAEFFRNTEPHSPVSYMLDKTVRYGRMPLPELLNELIPDHSAREFFSTMTGAREHNE